MNAKQKFSKLILLALLLASLSLSACVSSPAAPTRPAATPTSQPTALPQNPGSGAQIAQPTQPPQNPYPATNPDPKGGMVTLDKSPAVLAAKKALAEKLGIGEDQIEYISAQAVEWSDSCLGLGGPAESCLQAITPGYNVQLKAADKVYEIHTTEDGSSVRIKE